MKAIRLAFFIACSLSFCACESDLPPDPANPPVRFGNNQFREQGTAEEPAPKATDAEKTPW